MTFKFRVFLEKYFYFSMSILIAVVVVYGFSRTIDRRLIHPALPPPGLNYVHAVIFFGWLVFYILQSALIRMGRSRFSSPFPSCRATPYTSPALHRA